MENERILFENKTIYNKENLQNFSKFIFLKYNKFMYWEIIIFSFLFLTLGIIGAIRQITEHHTIPNTFTLIFILIFLIVIIRAIKIAKGNVKIKEKTKDILYKYEFYNDYLLISTELASQKILYKDISNIQNVCNTEKYIYIMTSKRTGYIFDKNGFENYNEKEFMTYLRDKFKDKFINFLEDANKKLFTMKDIAICLVLFLICGIMSLSFLSA